VYVRKHQQGHDTDVVSKDIRVGQLIRVKGNERIPADMILLHTTDESGHVFVRTD
jgi:phospholipid-translocating ATPase